MADLDIRDENNVLIKTEYAKDNYLIREYDNDSPYAIVYFASHGLYFPNTEECFRERIITQNRYEWMRYRRANVRKEIYVRDLWKAHYTLGINERISSLELLAEFIREQVGGLKLITVGNSAGGYAAVLIGTLLHADYILDFSGQNSIQGYLQPGERSLEQKIARTLNPAYCKISELWKSGEVPDLFFFYASHCEIDQEAWGDIAGISTFTHVYPIAFDEAVHGKTMYNFNLPAVLNMDKEQLRQIATEFQGKTISRFTFSKRIMGVPRSIMHLLSATAHKLLHH
ncbi:MAG: hypothetical protein K6G23_00845 [Lachnospiraceae bacterium]|nr:hypothetical protein [Lachnospiraceae bacterium]